jgi:pyruvate kinase
MPADERSAVDRTHAPDGGKAISPDRSAKSQARRLRREIVALRGEVLLEGGKIFDRWRPRIRREEFLPSARNLAHYLALRRHDLRDLQVRLMPWGLSSLGRCEARVLPTLNAVAAALATLGSEGGPEAQPETEAFFRGHELLGAHTEAVLGPTPTNRAVRIMATLHTQAAHEYELVRELVSRGTDVARINCAHDDRDTWALMAEHVRRASRETGRSCRLCFDLVGPRARVASTTVPHEGRLRLGDRILMTSSPTPVRSKWTHQFECSLPEVLGQLREGGSVRERGPAGCSGRAQAGRRAPASGDGRERQGRAPAEEQGLNFPTPSFGSIR